MTYGEVTAESLWASVKAGEYVAISADRRPLVAGVRRLAAAEGLRITTSTIYPEGMRSFGPRYGTINIRLRSET